jgi:NDP-sugar pyrophosphorylase family protein
MHTKRTNKHTEKYFDPSSIPTQSYELTEKRTRPMLDLTRTVADRLELYQSHPWDIIPGLRQYIPERGIDLPYDKYDEISENVWVHVSAYLSPTARIEAPAIICGGARICHNAHVKSSIIGAFATVGDHSSISGSIMFDKSKLCGQNTFLSSILGYESIIGYGSVCDNRADDGFNVTVSMPEGTYITGKQRIGSVICDGTKISALCYLAAGTVLDYCCHIKPLSSCAGYYPPHTEIK